MKNDNEKLSPTDKITDFVQKNRKGIFIVIGAFFLFFIGAVIFLSLNDYLNKKAIAEIEELNRRFEDVQLYIGEEYYADDIETLLAELETFAAKKKGFPAGKAWSIIARIYSEKQEWRLAEETWLNAARIGNKTYLGPMALFNAAAAAEEQGDIERAIVLLRQCLSHPFEFPAAARAQFSIGRLNEQLNDYPAALEAYRAVLINWSNTPVWQHLARSRITAIEIR
jgi:tetratricopeptide (TPR) repeat protein